MARFKLQPEATFRLKVALPVPGDNDAEVDFVFKYRDRAELEAFIASTKGMGDAEAIMQMVTGWDLADAFDRAAVDTLVRTCIPAPARIWEAYLGELTKSREKN